MSFISNANFNPERDSGGSFLTSLGRAVGMVGGAMVGGALTGGNPAGVAAGAQAGAGIAG